MKTQEHRENASGCHALANHGQAVHVVEVQLTVRGTPPASVRPFGETGHEPRPASRIGRRVLRRTWRSGRSGRCCHGHIAEQTLGIVHDTDATLDHAQRAGIRMVPSRPTWARRIRTRPPCRRRSGDAASGFDLDLSLRSRTLLAYFQTGPSTRRRLRSASGSSSRMTRSTSDSVRHHAAGMRNRPARFPESRALVEPPFAQDIEKFFHVYSR